MAKTATVEKTEIHITATEQALVRISIVGTEPFVCERVSEKAKGELLLPAGRKNAAEKAQSLKHNPLAEFRASPYIVADEESPTLVAVLAVSFKKAMMTAALDMPGAKKAQIGRLVRVEGERIPLYGIPQLFMSVVRSSDIGRTPDVRTRAILPRWACAFDVRFARPMLKEKAIFNLLVAAGTFAGVGGWRTEKGSGNFGSFRIANPDDDEFEEIVNMGGRAAQSAAMAQPAFYDDETENLFVWYNAELERRGIAVPS